ncbi:MAG: septal ring lytic transglycosylase RlpA family protein [Verrucomicrobiales bacterium]
MKSARYALPLCFLLGCLSGACSTSHIDRASSGDARREITAAQRRPGHEREMVVKTLQGKASWYSTRTNGTRTASGEPLSDKALTAAHRTLPFGSRVRVTNTANDRQVVVRITDRGPFGKGRVIDLSLEAAKQIDMISAGVVPVRVDVLK